MKARMAVGSGIVAATILGVASLAWGCTAFSMIRLNVSAGPPGAEVTVKGSNAASNAPVALRWDSRTGATSAQTMADANGAFSVPVKVGPSVGGMHFLLATDGKGDVARAAFEVKGLAAPSFVSTGVSNSSSQGTRPSVVGVGILGFGIFLAAVGTATGVRRRSAQPVRLLSTGGH